MATARRRAVLGGLAIGAAWPVAALADGMDGHAAGRDVAAAETFQRLIPRKPGDPAAFTASLDRAPIKATSGGWAREVTSRTLPSATALALAHLFLNPGGAREMHWHNSAEWAYVLGGHCQITVADAAGMMEVVNLAPGDLWYFPRGHAHAIQTLGTAPFHALLAFDDGLYSEHGTFGISDWMSRLDPAVLAQATGVPPSALAAAPVGETYIMQGPVLPLDGPAAAATSPRAPADSHCFALMQQAPWATSAGGAIQLADSTNFPMARTIAGLVLRMNGGAMQQLHWHADANEFVYVVDGQVRVMLFAAEKRMATALLGPGDCAYIPANSGHTLQNVGPGPCEVVGVLDTPAYAEAALTDWLARAPRHVLANNMGLPDDTVPAFAAMPRVIPATV